MDLDQRISKLQNELSQKMAQLQAVDNQRNVLMTEIFKLQGAIEELNRLKGEEKVDRVEISGN